MVDSLRFARTRALLGEEACEHLAGAHVAVFGIGGVGSYCVEALARSGVGAVTLVDGDIVDITNSNRQIIALTSTIGIPKVQVMRERIAEINPDCVVHTNRMFFLPESADAFDFSSYSYVVDCVDTIAAKISLIACAKACNTPVISSMGTGNKIDPTRFRVCDIGATTVDPLARVMRRELRKRHIEGVKVVCSDEPAFRQSRSAKDQGQGLSQKNHGNTLSPGSVAFVASVAGLILAGEVIRDLAGIDPV